VDIDKHDPHAHAWADGVYWVDIDKVPQLAFDHSNILNDALNILRGRVRRRPVGFELLPQKFTLAQIQRLYEVLLNETYDKGNFRKKILDMNLLTDLKESQTNVSHRPAKLYSFDTNRYEELKAKGLHFHM
jgi:8-oxo-dGTP diphosphatase